MKRRNFLVSSILGGGFVSGTIHAQVEAWPTRPIRVIVPFPPGTANDIAARVLAQSFGPQLSQPIVVENLTGAGGTIAFNAAAQAKNGHTLLLASTSMTIAPYASAVRYDVVRDFDAIGKISVFPGVLVVPANSSYRSVNDIVADARARPGGVVSGTGGVGTSSHLATELFMGLAGINLLQVPYRGEGEVVPNIISGTIPMAIVNLPSALRFIRSGLLRPLAVASKTPHPDLPGISTFGALGLPGVEALGWVVLLAPKGTPPAGLTSLEGMLQKALATPSVIATLTTAGVSPVIGGRVETDEFIKGEGEHWGRVIRTRNIKFE